MAGSPPGRLGLNVRLTLSLVAFGAVLAGCTTAPKVAVAPALPEIALSPDNPVGHPVDDLVAANGPPSLQRELPDGRIVYQWQSSSLSATVAPSARKGEIRAAGVSQTTCYSTLYAKADAKGVVRVVSVDDSGPGCLKLAMVGQAK